LLFYCKPTGTGTSQLFRIFNRTAVLLHPYLSMKLLNIATVRLNISKFQTPLILEQADPTFLRRITE
ncbi:hypothetical protein, partial [Endozoicomonas numazuensis]|uniref:hypothetical protein n=1 Tax=Endozoicomonas numazuensis TaxID=1137799 RepID=UPI001F3DD156